MCSFSDSCVFIGCSKCYPTSCTGCPSPSNTPPSFKDEQMSYNYTSALESQKFYRRFDLLVDETISLGIVSYLEHLPDVRYSVHFLIEFCSKIDSFNSSKFADHPFRPNNVQEILSTRWSLVYTLLVCQV